jgi:hypothetical protein
MVGTRGGKEEGVMAKELGILGMDEHEFPPPQCGPTFISSQAASSLFSQSHHQVFLCIEKIHLNPDVKLTLISSQVRCYASQRAYPA